MSGKFVRCVEDMPKVEHYAIFHNDSYYTEGNDGYPGHSTKFIQYDAYLTQEKLLEALENEELSQYSSRPRKIAKIVPMTVEKTLTLI